MIIYNFNNFNRTTIINNINFKNTVIKQLIFLKHEFL